MVSVLFIGLSLLAATANGAPPTITIGTTTITGTEFDPAGVEFFGGTVCPEYCN